LNRAATSLAGLLLVAAAVSTARAAPHASRLPPGVTFRPACANRVCQAWVAVDPNGQVHADDAPKGFGPADLQSAYNIDPTLGAGLTIAVVDAYGYIALESDLAVYRAQFGLPACTEASGCLTVVNGMGMPTPLPTENADWIGETALDIDMVSSACPLCKIIVVEADTDAIAALKLAQKGATKLGMDVISNSWEGAEDGDELDEEADYNNPGIGEFASSADYGYDTPFPGTSGATYPGTSQHVITVGGTHLAVVDPSVDPRGWVETAWSQAGSSCSTIIPKPSWQPARAECPMRADSDISAIADPDTGVAIYVAGQGGWLVYGGTSASSPFAAATFAAAGHADATPQFVYAHPGIYNDVTLGSTGSCGTDMCNAGAGWDGPTGLGTLDQAKIKAIGGGSGSGIGPDITITYPLDGATVQAGFGIEAAGGSDVAYIYVDLDGTRIGAVNTQPYTALAPQTIANGAHMVTVTAFDVDHNSNAMSISVTQGSAAPTPGDDDGGGGGCAAGGRGGAGALVLVGAALVRARRRRA
jgi:subtilase family serine protease